MPSYAVLGSTGNVGRSIVTVLLQHADNDVHAFVRSKQKLFKLLPKTQENQLVKVFEGSLDDSGLLADCISGCRAVFLAVATPGNQPGCTIAQDTARNVVSALDVLKKRPRPEYLPRLVILSSASTNHALMPDSSHFFKQILYCAFKNTYDDLKSAEKWLRQEHPNLDVAWIKPGALANEPQTGHFLSTEYAKTPVSFLDLAAGMVEVASGEGDEFRMKQVAVNGTAENIPFPKEAPWAMLRGLIVYLLPFMYRFLE